MAVTLSDISKATNINICSVSQVLNNHPRAQSLRPETRQKIILTAQRLGYCKNELASSVAQSHSKLLVFVTGDMGFIGYTGRIQNGVLDAAAELGYAIMVLRLKKEMAEEIIKKITGWRAAGVIFHVSDLSSIQAITSQLDAQQIPWGLVNLSNAQGLGVTSDDNMGIQQAIQYLVKSGHGKIMYIGNSVNHEYQQCRLSGFRQGMQKYLPAFRIEVYQLKTADAESQVAEWKQLIDRLLEHKITGVVCETDAIAVKLCQMAQAQGVKIPDAFSVIGFGNLVISQAVYPPLTTIEQDFENMGSLTVKLLIDQIQHRTAAVPINQLLPIHIVERESVAQR